jgi:hypothetical protein
MSRGRAASKSVHNQLKPIVYVTCIRATPNYLARTKRNHQALQFPFRNECVERSQKWTYIDTADDAFDYSFASKKRLNVRKVREHPGPADMEFDHMQVWIMNIPLSYHIASWIFLLMYFRYIIHHLHFSSLLRFTKNHVYNR